MFNCLRIKHASKAAFTFEVTLAMLNPDNMQDTNHAQIVSVSEWTVMRDSDATTLFLFTGFQAIQ